jgi:hypothetical protein
VKKARKAFREWRKSPLYLPKRMGWKQICWRIMDFRRFRERDRQMFSWRCSRSIRASLLALIKQWILPGTIIYSDCWKSYHNIQ